MKHLIYMENHGGHDLSDYSDSVQVHSMKAVMEMGRQPQQGNIQIYTKTGKKLINNTRKQTKHTKTGKNSKT